MGFVWFRLRIFGQMLHNQFGQNWPLLRRNYGRRLQITSRCLGSRITAIPEVLPVLAARRRGLALSIGLIAT